jgi:hypothetical protein
MTEEIVTIEDVLNLILTLAKLLCNWLR